MNVNKYIRLPFEKKLIMIIHIAIEVTDEKKQINKITYMTIKEVNMSQVCA